MPLLDPEVSAKLGTLQMLDDAIAYRAGQLSKPCLVYAPGQQCADHAHDAGLLDYYQDSYAAAFKDTIAGTDPNDVAAIMQPGDDLPPTAGLFALAMLGRLRELAADGPAVTELDGRTVLIELRGRAIVEYPLPPGGGNGSHVV